ncbi:hypothetical protein KP1_275 [Klebsiella phage KP1]|jgi:hypothetical protein|uniref:Uncharacterized protein n=1 Tax=Klebsiella phage KP1 TaxID=2070202 RepID=A0A2K9V643_9CAUD|nr:hypothetical protein KP1_275 [Klebsiella phage KP1]QEG11716.1 hypothetical protein KPN6_114 [Klebsiella phage KPN6]WFG79017.1 hypothetical protein VIPKPNUMC01_00010 [Klebsiella phage vB_VIPKPNUMC01]
MNFKEGVQYKFVNDEAEEEFSSRYEVNEDFVYELYENGGSFTVTKVDHQNNRVSGIMWANGTECDEVGGEDLVIFDSEFKYFTEVGTSANVIPTDLVMNLSIHNRGQAIAAIAALQSAYQC